LQAGGWYAHIHPDDLEKDAEDMRKLLNNEDVDQFRDPHHSPKNGEIRWERIFAHPIWSEEENRLAGIIGAVQDITGTKASEKLLKETLLRQNRHP
jgi:PAS domain S-box-containing protein